MAVRALAILGIIVVILAVACSGESDGSASEARIVFISDRDGNSEVYVMSNTGEQVTRLTDTEEPEDSPVWSPNGEKIAFRRLLSDGGSQFWIVDADGSNETLIAETDISSPPLRPESWSPDGSQILLQLSIDGPPETYIASTDGSRLDPLGVEGILIVPIWSPATDQVLLQVDVRPSRIATVRPDGSDLKELTVNGITPVWSPDGSNIAFVSNRDGNQEVYVMAADGSGLVNASQSSGSDGSTGVVWSPDGTRFAFYSETAETTDISVVNADGSGLTAITENAGFDVIMSQLTWSPNGERIALEARARDSSRTSDIIVLQADGSDFWNVTQTGAQEETLIGWSSNSQRVLFAGEPAPVELELAGTLQIFEVAADGEDLRALTDDPASHDQAALSPNN